MEQSLLAEINKKNLDTYLKERVYSAMYWPSFFPVQTTPFLTWEALVGTKGAPVAADIIAYDSSAPEKKRRAIDKLTGDIPKIAVKRTMRESDLNTYNILKTMANPDQQRLLDLVFGDVDFCVEGVNARLEWMALKILSRGQLTLTSDTNVGMITEATIDFQIPTAQKVGASVVWSAATGTTKPITDFETVQNAARLLGLKMKYALMTSTSWGQFRKSDETLNFVAPYALFGGVREKRSPNLQVANEALRAENLPEIMLIDQSITIEKADHTQVTANPWTEGMVTFVPDIALGSTQCGPIAEETNPPKQVTQSKKGPILVSKFSDVDPVREMTKAELNAMVVWPTSDQCWSMDSLDTSWS